MSDLATVLLSAAALGLLLLAWDFQRRWFQNADKQRDHEDTRVNALCKRIEPLLDAQAARDTRNDRALSNFVNEMKEGIKSLSAAVQKSQTAQVDKLAQMSRMGRRP